VLSLCGRFLSERDETTTVDIRRTPAAIQIPPENPGGGGGLMALRLSGKDSKLAGLYAAAAEARQRQLADRPPGAPFPPSGDLPEEKALAAALARSAGARKAQSGGATFEEDCLTWATAAGIVIFKIPNGAKWVYGKGGKLIPVPVQTPFDFSGCIPSLGGRSINFDAKRIDADQTAQSLRIGAKLVKPHQVEAIRRMGAARAVAGLIVQCGPRADVRWLDWRFVRHGDAIPWDSEKWFILSPIGRPIDFGRLVHAYESPAGGGVVVV
jgi:hypothetical protein